MDIKLKLNNKFVAALNKLKEEYGEEFDKLNGFHNSNLNFTDFIDNFIDAKSVADVTIDSNANSSSKDIRTLISDMMKPHTKLLAYNKIFYEITKEYGLSTAEDWLKNEWNGAFYLHDAASSTLIPYSYFGKECLYIKYKNKQKYCSFESLYSLLSEPEIYNKKMNYYAKYPKNLYVRDVVNEKQVWTKVNRVLNHSNKQPMRFLKFSNGMSQIVTEDHPVITSNGDILAKNIKIGDLVLYSSNKLAQNNYGKISEIDGIKLDQKLGYIVGMILAEGVCHKHIITICQDKATDIFKQLKYYLNKLCIKYTLQANRDRISLNSCQIKNVLYKLIKPATSSFKCLNDDFVFYPIEFLNGVLAGLFDGNGNLEGFKNRHGILRITSRKLLNQMSYFLDSLNLCPRDRTPYLPSSKTGFKSKLTMYGIGFSIADNEDYYKQINSVKIKLNYTNRKRKVGNFKNKKYTQADSNNFVSIVNNSVFIEDVKTVYDITTETGHFICNNILSHNCYAYDLEEVVNKGLFFVNNFRPEAAKHLTTFNDHVLEFISWCSNRTAGACGIPSYLVHSYYFWKNDVDNNFYLKDPEYYRKQCFQKFIYDLNQPYLRITECAFTNISIMDRNYLIEIFGGRQFPNGEFVIDHIEGIIEHQKVFMETLAEVRKKCMMTFPVVTYALLFQEGKFVDEDFARWCNKHNMQWYDSNFYLGDNVANLSSCCRMVNDTAKVKKAEGFINSIGGTSLSIGSVKVNTINLRRISLESGQDKEKFKQILRERVGLCIKALHIIRKIISRNVEKGLLPNYTYGLIKMENQYNTIGLTAMYEVIKDFGFIITDEFGNKSYSEEGLEFASDILNTVNIIKDEQTFDYSINVEIIPAERANVVLCKKDSVIYGEKEEFIYSNQWIPLMQKCTIQEKVKLGAILDRKCGGGQIMHVNIQGQFSTEEQAWDLLNYIAKEGVIYMAYNPKISTCSEGHGFFGDVCPECGGQKTDEFTRIVGYLVPSNAYGKERKYEFSKRYWYVLDD